MQVNPGIDQVQMMCGLNANLLQAKMKGNIFLSPTICICKFIIFFDVDSA